MRKHRARFTSLALAIVLVISNSVNVFAAEGVNIAEKEVSYPESDMDRSCEEAVLDDSENAEGAEFSLLDDSISDSNMDMDEAANDALYAGEYPRSGECGKVGSSVHWAVSGSNDDLTLTISGSGEMEDEPYTGGPWGEDFIGNKIKHLVIEDGITSIGEYAFFRCEGLESVVFPDSLKNIGDNAFFSCNGITDITLPSKIESIGKSSFMNCSNLLSITLPATLSNIGKSAFLGCSKLESVSANDESMFFSSQDGVLFDKEMTTLYLYPAGKKDTTYSIPDTVEDIYNGAFWGARNLTGFPSGGANLKNIMDDAFSHCKFTYMEIPDTVEIMGCSDNLHELTSVHLPKGLKCLRDETFGVNYDNDYNHCGLPVDSSNEFIMELDPSNPYFYIENNTLFYRNDEYGDELVGTGNRHVITDEESENVDKYMIPNGTRRIWKGAFESCRYSNIVIPESVIEIGQCSFTGCENLSSLTFPEGVKKIGNGIFQNSAIQTIYLPHSLESVGSLDDQANDLTDIYYNGTSAEWKALYTYKLQDSIKVHCKDTDYSDEDNDYWNLSGGVLSITCNASMPSFSSFYDQPWYDQRKSITKVIINSGVKSISNYAFCGLSNLSQVEFQERSQLQSIGAYAFYGCPKLGRDTGALNIPASVSQIGSHILNSISAILDGRDSAIESVSSFELPATVTNIGSGAFSGTGFSDIIIAEENEKYKSENGLVLSKDGSVLIFAAPALTDVVVPETVTEIADNAFSASSIRKIAIPVGVTVIDKTAFWACSSLKEISYEGTKSQWEALKEGGNISAGKIICSDGIIERPDPIKPDDQDDGIQVGDLPIGAEIPDGVWIGGLKKSYPYTGNAIKPEVRVYYQSKRLTEGVDYTLGYKKNKAVGTSASVTVKCKGDFKGSKTVNFAIEKNPLTAVSYEENNLILPKDGKKHNNIKPVLLMDGEKLKISKNDFDYKYLDASGQESDCTETGSYTVRMTAKSTSKGYSNYIDIPFTVTDKTPMSKVAVTASKKSLPYNGEKQIPTFTLKYNKQPLAAGSYTMVELVGDNYTAPGNHTVIFKGNGTDVIGSRRYTYKITGKKVLGNNKLTVASIAASSLDKEGKVPYANGGAKPKVSISYDGIRLKEGRDYTLSYKGNTSAGSSATVTAKGKGKYSGSIPVSFTVSQRNLDSMLLTVSDRAVSNKAEDYKKTLILFTDSDYTDQKLKADKDYTAEFTVSSGSAKPAVGETVTVLIKAKEGGNYTGQATATFNIIDKAKDISRAKVKVNGGKAYEYTGKAIEPTSSALSITLGGKSVNTSDYEIAAYYNNVKRSSNAVIIIKGKDGLSGMKAVKFKIGVSPLEKFWKGLIGD